MRHSRWVESAIMGAVIIVGFGVAACEQGTSHPSATTSTTTTPSAVATATPAASAAAQTEAAEKEEQDAAAEDFRSFHRHHHHGGVAMFVSLALDTLGLEPTQKATIENLQAELHTAMAPAREAEHELLSVLAAGVAAGKIDTVKVDAALAKLGTASAGIHASSMGVLTKLHAALTSAERAALVEKVKAHAEMWRKVNAEQKLNSAGKGTHLAKLTQLLGLSQEQVAKIETALNADVPITPQNDPKAVDTYVDAFAKSFSMETFDPTSLTPAATAAAGHTARYGGARMARFYEAVTPVLTATQRTELAAHLEDRLKDHYPGAAK